MRWGNGDELVHDPVFVQDCFNQCTPAVSPACLLKTSPSKGRASRGREWGWSHFPFFSIFILLFVTLPREFRFGGGVFPLSPRRRPGSNPGPSPLPPYLQPFIVCTVGLLPHRILR
jgi:hypothetical protein